MRNIQITLKLLKMGLFMMVALLVFLILGIESLYQYGLSALPENTAPAQANYAQELRTVQWIELGGNGEMQMQKIYPETFLFDLFVKRKQPSQNSRIAYRTARILLERSLEKNFKKHRPVLINTLAIGIWISQHWTAEEALNTILNEQYYGKQLFGIRAAAQAYFKKEPSALNSEEIIFLVALSRGPDYANPCHSENLLSFINILKGRLLAVNPQSYADLKLSQSLPLDIPCNK